MQKNTAISKQHEAAIRTMLRAYGIGWAVTTAPAILSLVIKIALKPQQQQNKLAAIKDMCLNTLPDILKNSVLNNGFPILAAGALSGHRFLLQQDQQQDQQQQLQQSSSDGSKCADKNLGSNWTFVLKSQKRALFLSAFITFWSVRRLFPKIRTLDVTFFALVRAADVYAHRMYVSPRVRRILPNWMLDYGNIGVFMLASTEIIYTWFYEPERLPKSYEKWITDMAGIDGSLRKLLQLVKKNEIVYGKDTAANQILYDYCDKLRIPRSLGDPLNGRVHCSIVHEGNRWGCEVNAFIRFLKGFKKIFPVYFFVHLAPPLFFRTKRLLQNPVGSASHILTATIRSSTFLGSFIAIIWYCVCLTRTRIGYKILGIPQQTLDTTAPLLGSMLCGLSLLIESRHRRGEMALYVVPRALFSFMERVLSQKMKKGVLAEMAENVVFSTSVMILLGAIYHDSTMVRPSVRGLLSWILKEEIQEQRQHQQPVDDDNATVVATSIDSKGNSDDDSDMLAVVNSTDIEVADNDEVVDDDEIQLEILKKKRNTTTGI